MKYEICNPPIFSQKKLTFNDLIPGDIFRVDEYIYFRPELRDDVPYNAISLSDGDYEFFEKDETIERYTGIITFFEDHFKNKQED